MSRRLAGGGRPGTRTILGRAPKAFRLAHSKMSVRARLMQGLTRRPTGFTVRCVTDPTHDRGDVLEAGAFGAWLDAMRRALRREADADVPCGDCCACCSTSHFVHIGPDERETLARVPCELIFPAPGLPAGHVLLPYDERGRCPLLDERGRCTIYAHRPLTCRTYDCRVFTAAGIDADREPITRRARRWRFTCTAPDEAERLAAVRAAAHWIPEHAAAFPGGRVPDDPSQLAVLAVQAADVFLPDGPAGAGAAAAGTDGAAIAAAVVRATVAHEREPRPGPASPAAAYLGHGA